MSKILIAIPHTGNIRAELAERLLSLNQHGHEIKMMLSWGRPITENRKAIVKTFLESDFEYLLQIDSDIEPPADIIKMVDNGVDICSADIHTTSGQEIIRLGLEKTDDGYKTKKLVDGLNEVDATGTGCLLLSRKAAELGFTDAPSEDFDFCERAIEAGFKVYYDTRYRCKHFLIYPL